MKPYHPQLQMIRVYPVCLFYVLLLMAASGDA